MTTAPKPRNRQRIRLVQADEGRRSPSRHSVHPLLLWLGVLGGPVAFALVRLAGGLLLAGSCRHPAGSAALLGLSPSQVLMAAITALLALVAASSGLLSWHSWRQTRQDAETQSGESTRAAPFWALGGLFVGGIFFVLILLTGGLALGLSTTCAS